MQNIETTSFARPVWLSLILCAALLVFGCSRYQQERIMTSNRSVAGKTELSLQTIELKLQPPLTLAEKMYTVRLYISGMEDGKASDFRARCVSPRPRICLQNGQIVDFYGEMVMQDGRAVELTPEVAGFGVADLTLSEQSRAASAIVSFSALRLRTSQPQTVDHVILFRYEPK
jgi:hypothetical protein